MSSINRYLSKMSGGSAAASRTEVRESVISGFGGVLGIGLCSFLSVACGFPWLTAPFGATSALIFGAHRSPLAQPRNVVGGYMVSACAGLVTLLLFGSTWWSPALGAGLAIGGMIMARVLHPPAGGVPIVMITSGATWLFLLRPVLIGSVLLVLVAMLYNNLFRNRRYPEYW